MYGWVGDGAGLCDVGGWDWDLGLDGFFVVWARWIEGERSAFCRGEAPFILERHE